MYPLNQQLSAEVFAVTQDPIQKAVDFVKGKLHFTQFCDDPLLQDIHGQWRTLNDLMHFDRIYFVDDAAGVAQKQNSFMSDNSVLIPLSKICHFGITSGEALIALLRKNSVMTDSDRSTLTSLQFHRQATRIHLEALRDIDRALTHVDYRVHLNIVHRQEAVLTQEIDALENLWQYHHWLMALRVIPIAKETTHQLFLPENP